MGQNKICIKCRKDKPLEEFYADNARLDRKHRYCKVCSGSASKQWKIINRQRHTDKCRAWRRAHPIRTLLLGAKKRAANTKMAFTIEEKDLLPVPIVCPVLGIPLVYGGGLASPNAASLDRVDNEKGYTKENTIIVSLRANQLKRDATVKELKAIATFYGAV